MSRYHDYRREILGEADFTLFVETVTLEQMNDFRDYVVNEYRLRQEIGRASCRERVFRRV